VDDDLTRNIDEDYAAERRNSYYRIMLAEAWRIANNPTYKGSFLEIDDLVEKINALVAHEVELTRDVPHWVFEKRNRNIREAQAEYEVLLCHISPQPTPDISFSVDTSTAEQEEVESGDEGVHAFHLVIEKYEHC